MLFWLKKILTLPFLPLYFCLITGALGLVLLWLSARQRTGKALVLISLLSLATFSNKGVSTKLILPLENSFPAVPEIRAQTDVPTRLSKCTAIVVLGGGHADAPSLSRINQLSTASMSRIGEAVRISRWLPTAKFVVSGHHIKTLSHAQVLGEAAVSLGVDPSRIVRMDDPRDTEDEITDVASRFPGQTVAVVTSAWHMPRTIRLCEKIGVDAVPCPADFIWKVEGNTRPDYLSWELESLERSTKAIREYLGMTWLKLRGK